MIYFIALFESGRHNSGPFRRQLFTPIPRRPRAPGPTRGDVRTGVSPTGDQQVWDEASLAATTLAGRIGTMSSTLPLSRSLFLFLFLSRCACVSKSCKDTSTRRRAPVTYLVFRQGLRRGKKLSVSCRCVDANIKAERCPSLKDLCHLGDSGKQIS